MLFESVKLIELGLIFNNMYFYLNQVNEYLGM